MPAVLDLRIWGGSGKSHPARAHAVPSTVIASASEAIHLAAQRKLDCVVAALLATTLRGRRPQPNLTPICVGLRQTTAHCRTVDSISMTSWKISGMVVLCGFFARFRFRPARHQHHVSVAQRADRAQLPSERGRRRRFDECGYARTLQLQGRLHRTQSAGRRQSATATEARKAVSDFFCRRCSSWGRQGSFPLPILRDGAFALLRMRSENLRMRSETSGGGLRTSW